MNESTIIRLGLIPSTSPWPCHICGQEVSPDEEGLPGCDEEGSPGAYAYGYGEHVVCLECIESGIDAIKARLLERAEEDERRAKALVADPLFADEALDLTVRAAVDRADAAEEWGLPTVCSPGEYPERFARLVLAAERFWLKVHKEGLEDAWAECERLGAELSSARAELERQGLLGSSPTEGGPHDVD